MKKQPKLNLSLPAGQARKAKATKPFDSVENARVRSELRERGRQILAKYGLPKID